MSNYGYHWSPCNRASGAGLGIAVVGAIVAYANRHAIERAASDLLEIVLVSFLAAVVITVTAAVLIWRHRGHRPASMPEQITAFHEARQVRAATARAAVAPAQHHLHLHFEGAAQPEAVLRAINENKQEQS